MEKAIIIAIVFGAIGLLAWKMKKLLKGEDSCCGCGNPKECGGNKKCS